MWTRESLKRKAKDFLKEHYWKALVVCLIAGIFSNSYFKVNYFKVNKDGQHHSEVIETDRNKEFMEKEIPLKTQSESINYLLNKRAEYRPAIKISTFILIGLIFIFVSILIGNNLHVGLKRFFLKGLDGDVDTKYLISTFKNKEYWGIIKTIFIVDIANALWYLLFIIPGIVKSYEYRMVPYIVSENPGISASDAIDKSREMTDGQKWDIFVLDLSFLGWHLLGALFFGIGVLFVEPYIQTTFAELYRDLSGKNIVYP